MPKVVKIGKLCIEVRPADSIAHLHENLCIGCGICIKTLPAPRSGQVLGLLGTSGIGKSTALKILSGKLKPNLGKYDNPPDWEEILKHFRGSELRNYFTKVVKSDTFKAIIKPQYVDQIPRMIKGKLSVSQMLDSKLEQYSKEDICRELELTNVLEREASQLSGGELQRFAIAMSCIQKADIYMFDEPSSYLDIRQRLQVAHKIRDLLTPDNYVIAVEHDLSVLDYLSDYVCCLYGKPSIYGVVTTAFPVLEGINIILDGFIPTENLRLRDEPLSFKMADSTEQIPPQKTRRYSYPTMTKTLGSFKLTVESGEFGGSEVIVMLGENGTGKTTFVRLLAGDAPDEGSSKMSMNVSLKPQKIAPKFPGTTRMLLLKQIKAAFMHPRFNADVVKPMQIENILDRNVSTLSGGELQRVAIVLALGKPADVFLLDEPSSFLDSELRVIASQVIRRHVLYTKRTAFVIEHDFIMAMYLADRVILFQGQPAVAATATPPQSLLTGMNQFLASLEC
ncbi:RNAse L inhibitor-type ATP binding cassette protein [Ceratobasidium sp. AG-I]|nr:RNAse L inhibitor-type ATP binding cassette protein [Ceratobasidium sp. AG-I]